MDKMAMRFPITLDRGIPTLGYLVAYVLREQQVDLGAYRNFVRGLRHRYDPRQVDLLQVKRRRASDNYAQAVKNVGRLKDNAAQASRERVVFFRKPGKTDPVRDDVRRRAKRGTLRKVILEERLRGQKAPRYTYLGDAYLNANGQVAFEPDMALSAENRQRLEDAMQAVEREFDRLDATYPSSMLKSRLGKLLRSTCPVAYDAEHLFRFVPVKDRGTLALIDEVIAFLNAETGATARSKRCDMSVLPLPDLADVRANVREAILDEIRDIATEGREAATTFSRLMGADAGEELTASTIERVARKVRHAQELLKRYATEYQLAAEHAAEGLQEVQRTLAAVRGHANKDKGTHVASWRGARRYVAAPAQVVGDVLVQQPGTWALADVKGDVVTWLRRDAGNRKQVVVTCVDLADSEDAHLVMTQEPPEAVQADEPGEGFMPTGLGTWRFDGPPEVAVRLVRALYSTTEGAADQRAA